MDILFLCAPYKRWICLSLCGNSMKLFIFMLFFAFFKMVSSCLVYGYTSWMVKGSGISFHRVSHRNPELLRKWIQFIRGENWKPNQNNLIYGVHFNETFYQVRPGKMDCGLKPDAVPSVFPPFLEHLQKSCSWRKPPKREKSLSSLYILNPCLPLRWLKQIILI